MIIDSTFKATLSDTDKCYGAMIRANQNSGTAYVINYNCPIATTDTDGETALQAKINAFVFPTN